MPNSLFDIAIFQKKKQGQYLCGDSYFYKEFDDELICVIADGLGSGVYAKESADAVIEVIKDNPRASEEVILDKCIKQLAYKRGVVLGILKIDVKAKKFTFSTIGNIGLITVDGTKKNRNIPNPGYLAGYKRDFKVMNGELKTNMAFYLSSDGLTENELANRCFLNENLHHVMESFKEICKEPRKDDTTLIAIKYKE